ncbi:hypothetical protein GCM10010124_03910 [Pilimelia terevasa]|uniref:Secreted protein n=1 Tax=Pilimelia terevasa TaxID=53372 RepID=A0A8J3BHG9_9ACTN|nr:hypothetical protein [Pilimelia terevasa]GGK14595.1 hypothetical protein GCM10010124_03910 [Pilimelia terevasa]
MSPFVRPLTSVVAALLAAAAGGAPAAAASARSWKSLNVVGVNAAGCQESSVKLGNLGGGQFELAMAGYQINTSAWPGLSKGCSADIKVVMNPNFSLQLDKLTARAQVRTGRQASAEATVGIVNPVGADVELHRNWGGGVNVRWDESRSRSTALVGCGATDTFTLRTSLSAMPQEQGDTTVTIAMGAAGVRPVITVRAVPC